MTSGVSSTSTLLLYFLAIILPPLAVFLASGCSVDFLINICLTILGWIPGALHALYVVSKRDRATETADPLLGGGGTAPTTTTAQAPVAEPYVGSGAATTTASAVDPKY